MGAASKVWLHHSLVELNGSLGNKLLVFCGIPIKILSNLITQYAVTHVHWNRCYEPWVIERDKTIKLKLSKRGIQVKSFNGSLL